MKLVLWERLRPPVGERGEGVREPICRIALGEAVEGAWRWPEEEGGGERVLREVEAERPLGDCIADTSMLWLERCFPAIMAMTLATPPWGDLDLAKRACEGDFTAAVG